MHFRTCLWSLYISFPISGFKVVTAKDFRIVPEYFSGLWIRNAQTRTQKHSLNVCVQYYVLTSVVGNLRCCVRHGCQERRLSCIWEPDGDSTQQNLKKLTSLSFSWNEMICSRVTALTPPDPGQRWVWGPAECAGTGLYWVWTSSRGSLRVLLSPPTHDHPRHSGHLGGRTGVKIHKNKLILFHLFGYCSYMSTL